MPFVRYLWREFFCAEKLDSSVTVFSVFFPVFIQFFSVYFVRCRGACLVVGLGCGLVVGGGVCCGVTQ